MKQLDEFIAMLQSIKGTRTLEQMSVETDVKVPTLSRILNHQRVPGGVVMAKLLIAYPRLAECFWDGKKVVG